MRAELRQALAEDLGAELVSVSRISGGDINEAFRVELAKGRAVFIKSHSDPQPQMFQREAKGLTWLGSAKALRVPKVINFRTEGISYLALEFLESAPRAKDHDQRLGRGLAELHRSGAPSFGFQEDNYIGSLPQDNTEAENWAEFYVSRRLEPLLMAARDAGHLGRSDRVAFDALFSKMPDLVGPIEKPARLHGDLWGGNAMVDDEGQPVLIDPAVYGGHREIDLAMMRLFGGFSEGVFGAYAEVWPLAPGYQERVALYQLYPLLVHVNLFGSSYVSQLERALSVYV